MLVAFGMVLAVTLGTGGFALSRLAQVDGVASQGSGRNLAAENRNDRAYEPEFRAIQNRRRACLGGRFGPGGIGIEADLKQRAEDVGRQRGLLDAMAMDDAARGVARDFDQAWQEYQRGRPGDAGPNPAGHQGPGGGDLQWEDPDPGPTARASAARLMEMSVTGGHDAASRGEAVYASARLWIIGALVLAVLMCGAAGVIAVRGVSTPVLAMAGTMRRMADGDLGTEISGLGRNDEIGRMAQALEVFRGHAIERARLEQSQIEQDRRGTEERQAALVDMAQTIENETTTALEQIGQRTGAMTATADVLSSSASRAESLLAVPDRRQRRRWPPRRPWRVRRNNSPPRSARSAARSSQSTMVVGRAVSAGSETRATIEALNEQVAGSARSPT